jgi:hypothetical protein
MNQKTKTRLIITAIGLVVIVLAAGGTIAYIKRGSVVPRTIAKQVNFVIFYPKPSQQTGIEEKTFKYSSSLGQVSFIVNFAGQQITFAEQSSPDSFSVDPSFYSAFIQKLNGYATFDSIDGRVDLTQPTEVNAQTAIMNAKGTLLFAKASGNISENNWRLLFNSVVYNQPS